MKRQSVNQEIAFNRRRPRERDAVSDAPLATRNSVRVDFIRFLRVTAFVDAPW